MPTPTPIRVRKYQLLSTLYQVYATLGYGAQATSPTLPILAPDPFSQAIVADMSRTPPTSPIAIYTRSIPDPTKVGLPRPAGLPPADPWPPLIQIDLYYLSTAGISLYEGLDPDRLPVLL